MHHQPSDRSECWPDSHDTESASVWVGSDPQILVDTLLRTRIHGGDFAYALQHRYGGVGATDDIGCRAWFGCDFQSRAVF